MAWGKKNWFILLAVVGAVFFVVVFAAVLSLSLSEGDVDISYGSGVGLVEVRDEIVTSDDAVRQLNKYRDNSSVKAIVVRVESPGGGVAASQEIHQAILRAGEKKPVVCSMGEVAASGGYYVACGCDSIVANAGTLTGSIGVLMEYPVIDGLIRKIGVRFEVIKAGKNKDIGSIARPLTPGERALLQAMLDDVHQQFIEAVYESRRIPMETLRKYTDGRVFSGRQALELGLVDRIGTLDDAIDLAGAMGGIKGTPRIIRERKHKRSLYDLLFDVTETASQLKRNGVELKYLMR